MASEQMPRREKVETEIHVEKHLQGGGDNRKEHAGRARESLEKGTHFESLGNKEKERKFYCDRTRDANVVQDKEGEREVGDDNNRKEHAGRARESHEKGTHFESLANKEKERNFYADRTRDANVVLDKGAQREVGGGDNRKDHAREGHEKGTHFESLADKEKERRFYADRTRDANVVQDKEAERGGSAGGVHNVGKFEMKAEGKGLGEEARRSREKEELGRRKVESEKAIRTMESRGEAKARDRAETKDVKGRLGGGEVQGRGRESREEGEHISKVGGETKGVTAEITCRLEGEELGEQKGRGRQEARGGRRKSEENDERAKQAASEKLGGAIQTAQEKSVQAKDIAMEKAAQAKNMAAQAKDVTIEKGQQGYVAAKVNAMEKAAQAKNIAAQAKDVTVEKGQQGYVAAKDTIAGAAKSAVNYTAPAAEKAKDYTAKASEKAKSAGATTAQYVGDKAVQAKDVTVETGKTGAEYAGKMAADLKDRATAAGWNAAQYSTDKTVEGTKAAANVVQGAAGYAGQKAYELGAKSMDAVKNLAAVAGETAKEYTTRKKEEVERELEAKRAARNQVGNTEGQSQGQKDNVAQREHKPFENNRGKSFEGEKAQPQRKRESEVGNTVGQAQGHHATKGIEAVIVTGETAGNAADREQKPFESISGKTCHGEQKVQDSQGKGSEAMTTTIRETLGNVAQSMKKPLDIATEGGSRVLGAVGETVAEIGETMMTKPAQKVQQQGQEGKGVGVLSAIGETIAEIAETTKVFVVGEAEPESRQSIGTGSCDSGRRGEFKQEQ